MIRILFWALVALDLAGIVLWFLLGLAAAGSARTSPLQVVFLLLVLPSVLLGAVVLLYLRAPAAGWRMLAVVLAAAPLLIAVSSRAYATLQFRTATNAAGELTFFRAGPMRELAEAIGRNEAAAVRRLAGTVDVNQTGLQGMTPLMLAMRQLRRTPGEQEVLRTLLAAGADPNRGAQSELPLSIALQLEAKAGPEPVRLLLDAGADPNLLTEFSEPVWFAAAGRSASLESLALLLDRGANLNVVARDGQTALLSTALTQHWKAAHFLLDRGADPTLGRSVNGETFAELIVRYADSQPGDADLAALRQRVAPR